VYAELKKRGDITGQERFAFDIAHGQNRRLPVSDRAERGRETRVGVDASGKVGDRP